MQHEESSTKNQKSPPRARSAPPSRGTPSPTDAEISGAKAYLDLFGPPALASTEDTFFQSVAVLSTILEGAPIGHAHTIVEAAKIVAESHVERRLAGGGQDR